MKFGKGWLILGIITSLLGVAAFVTGLAMFTPGKLDKFKNEYKQDTIYLVDSSEFELDVDKAIVNIYSTTGTSYINYNVSKYTNVKQEKNEIKFNNKLHILGFIFDWYDDNTIDVYLNSSTSYDFNFELDAGKLTINDSINFERINADIDAGEVNLGTLTVENSTKLNLDAGEIKIMKLETKKLDIDIDAGRAKLDLVDCANINVDIDAGELNMKLVGSIEDYTIDTDVDFGSCNVKDRTGGEKNIKVNIDAGKVIIDFQD